MALSSIDERSGARGRRIALALAVGAIGLGTGAAIAAAIGAVSADPPPAAARLAKQPVRIKGSIEELYPGSRELLEARVRNRSRRRLYLRWVRVRVIGDGGELCPAELLKGSRVNPKRILAPGKRFTVRLPMALSAAAPDQCELATWPLRYRAGVQAVGDELGRREAR